LVVGRKHGELRLSDPQVSSRHCRIVPREGGYLLQDLGSTNGTTVDGKTVREVLLEPGAEIIIGSSRLVLYVGEDSAQTEEVDPEVADAHLHIAWLLDEELVEIESGDTSTMSMDVIGQDLRLPPGVNAAIEVVSGADTGKLFRFTRGNIAIGRRCGEIPLSDVEVSRRHAVVEVFGREMIFLRDLGSTNGTYHNGRRVTFARIAHGDTVGCGKTVMKLQLSV
jgi:pSer/pThr/pTyr-binding forkhead associated (FHA) protein